MPLTTTPALLNRVQNQTQRMPSSYTSKNSLQLLVSHNWDRRRQADLTIWCSICELKCDENWRKGTAFKVALVKLGELYRDRKCVFLSFLLLRYNWD